MDDDNLGDMSILKAIPYERKEEVNASQLRSAILKGFQDEISGRSVIFSGDLRVDIKKYNKEKF